MTRLEATGTYTDDEINRLARRGKQRGHIPGVGRFESAGTSVSGGCGDDEENADDQEDEDEDGDDDNSMASSSSSFHSAPAASSCHSWIYDVFLSFRGEDTRKNFVDHLYSALSERLIDTYKDDEKLPRGDSIGPSLLKAIEESQMAVIIFSKNYADSSWCLDELQYIMKCRDERGQIVMPIFYDVEPSEVRKQKGQFGQGFAKHESENNKKVESWRNALVAVANLAGWEPKHIANG
nr:TMV resistance protein N-like [Tanacetum cinerariifolium]